MTVPHKAKLPVTIIGGYLGSGKTTLVNHLLRTADGLRLAILVNDFGELPIDRDLIEAEDDDIITIAGGCVCCSYGNDLVTAMMNMAGLAPRPDQVILETSGVAIPGPISASLALLAEVQLDAIVVMADIETVTERASDRYVGDVIRGQLRDADIIVANKTDLLDPDAAKERLSWLRTANPDAVLVATEHGQLPRSVVVRGFAERFRESRDIVLDDGRFGSFTVYFPNGVDIERLAGSLASAALDLVRTKGFVQDATGTMRLVQTVARRSYVTDAPEEVEPGIVCIGMKETIGATRSQLSELFPGAEVIQ